MAVQSLTILMVDDDVVLLAALGAQLEQAGYRVIKTSETAQAELLLLEQQPDLVLLEVASSRNAGWTLLERLAGIVPVVVLSSQGLEEQIVQALDTGAVDYITKPYHSAELLARLRVRLQAAGTLVASSPPASPHPASRQASANSQPAPAQPTPPPEQVPGWVQQASDGAVPLRTARQQAADDEEPVFIDDASEAALLQVATPPKAERQLDPQLAQMPLSERLAAARRRRNLSLVQVENETRIRMWYLQAMEEGKFAMLPRGDQSEQLVRSYASYLGLDAAGATEEFQRLHYNPPTTPLSSLGGSPATPTRRRWPLLLLAALLALLASIGGILLFDPAGVQQLANTFWNLISR